MRTNVILDDDLVAEAMSLTRARTKTGVIHHALRELVRLERLRRVRKLRGRLHWEGDLDLLRERRPEYGTGPRRRTRS